MNQMLQSSSTVRLPSSTLGGSTLEKTTTVGQEVMLVSPRRGFLKSASMLTWRRLMGRLLIKTRVMLLGE
jgi:hypothetical protein